MIQQEVQIQVVNEDRKIAKITLDDEGWSKFIESIRSALLSEKISEEDVAIKCDELRERQCAPLLPSGSIKFLKGITIPTTIAAVVNGEYGDLYYRAWWAENGGAIGTAKVESELGSNTILLSNEFKGWFNKLPFGSTLIGKFAVNKHTEHFDISAVRAWLAYKYNIDLDSDKNIKTIRMRAWVWSAELVALWFHAGIVKTNDSGFSFISI